MHIETPGRQGLDLPWPTVPVSVPIATILKGRPIYRFRWYCGAIEIRQGLSVLMVVCNMHATVLHEDTRLVSGDFPAATRQFLQKHVCGRNCPIVYHMGPSGNQSPRHVVRGHTLEEADRLGGLLGQAIATAISSVRDLTDIDFGCATAAVDSAAEAAFVDRSGRDAPILRRIASRNCAA